MNKGNQLSNKIVPTIRSSDIDVVLDRIGEENKVMLEGEVRDLAGVLNSDAAYEVRI